MIKGRYVALVEIDIHLEEKESLRPFEDIKNDVMNGKLTEELLKIIEYEFATKEEGDVKVTQQYADMYRVEDGDTDD